MLLREIVQRASGQIIRVVSCETDSPDCDGVDVLYIGPDLVPRRYARGHNMECVLRRGSYDRDMH